MTEPTVSSVETSPPPTSVGPGMSTATDQGIASQSTVVGPVVRLLRAPETSQDETDPVLVWLASAQARQYENHWVALDPSTGSFLGFADSLPDLRRWQGRGATIIFVDPPQENWLEG